MIRSMIRNFRIPYFSHLATTIYTYLETTGNSSEAMFLFCFEKKNKKRGEGMYAVSDGYYYQGRCQTKVSPPHPSKGQG